MLRSLIAVVAAFGAWLVWSLVGEIIGAALSLILSPVTRPLWRMIVRARTPWPLAIMLLCGVVLAVLGLSQMHYEHWRGTVGFFVFLAGASVTVASPFLWRDAKVEAKRHARLASRPVV